MKVDLKGDTVERYLARRNKSKSWLALRLGISSGYLSQLLDGTRHPSPRMRDKFLEVLPDFEFDDLFDLNQKERA